METIYKKKFAFKYRDTKPEEDSPIEYSFEQLRAKQYLRDKQLKEKWTQELHKEIDQLREDKKLLEEKLVENDYLLAKKDNLLAKYGHFHNHTNQNYATFSSSNHAKQMTTTFGDLTNVTQYESRFVAPFELEEEQENTDHFSQSKRDEKYRSINESLMPPPVLSLSSNQTMINVAASNMTTMCDSNKTLTARTHEARQMINQMLNQTETTADNDDDSWDTINTTATHTKNNETVPTISIYKDDTQTDMKLDEEAERPSARSEKDAKQRKPLGIIEDNESKIRIENGNHSEISALHSPSINTGSTTKILEFEPPAASTRNIRPLLNKMAQNDTELLDEITLNEKEIEKNSMQLNNSLKQKIKNVGLSPITKINQTKKVKFTDDAALSSQSPQVNCSTQILTKPVHNNNNNNGTFNGTQMTMMMTQMNMISWDYDYMNMIDQKNHQVDPISNENNNQSNIRLNMTEFQTEKIVLPNNQIQNSANNNTVQVPNMMEEQDELLTKDKLEQTFNNDYYKLCNYTCMNQTMSNNNTTCTGVTKYLREANKLLKLNEEKEAPCDQPRGEEKARRAEISVSEAAQSPSDLAQNNLNNQNETVSVSNASGSTFVVSDLDSTSSELTTADTTTTNLNETIMFAIREPFNYEIKNRLLNRGAIDDLKSRENFKTLATMMPAIRLKTIFPFQDKNYNIIEDVGNGAFAKIYLVKNVKDEKRSYALKVDKQATAWEFYITETIHERLNKMLHDRTLKINVLDSFIRMNQFTKYNNGCLSIMNFYKHGTLLNLVNYHVQNNETFPYWFVLYLTLELLYILNYLHKCQIVHADIKADNLLVNQLPSSIDYFDSTRTKCLVLIDYNRSIDLSILPSEAEFNAKTDNKSLLCTEMKSDKTWTYQIDYYGILSCIHCIIFKKYMSTFLENDRFRCSSSLPRSFDKLFAKMFDTFLNIPSCQELPDLQNEFIKNYVVLFKTELGASFSKSKKYLQDLNASFK